MRYIGPFFRMNSLNQDEVSSQLFYLSKESIKTIVLKSKCGILAQSRDQKNSSTKDISILNGFSPLICLYKKSSPVLVHSKNSQSFDESTFKKEINPSTNALMTLSLIELSEYYSHYNNKNIENLEKPYLYLAKQQLNFYCENLRNAEGLFVNKKNISDSNSKNVSLTEKNNKFKFSDQAFMMDAYLLYYFYNKKDPISEDYHKFSNEILNLFTSYKDALYDLSFDENIQILLALNIYHNYSKDLASKKIILDLGDFLINKFEDKDYFSDSIDCCSLFSICLMDSYKHTGIIAFKEKATEINEKLVNLYDNNKNIFLKSSDKKETKYSCLDINCYLLSIMKYSQDFDKVNKLKPIISSLYRKFFINGGLVTSWPEAPTLDEVERYRNLSLHSEDMLDETFFKMPSLNTPKTSSIASIFAKSITYSNKKDSITSVKSSFDSNKNMFSFYLIIYLLKQNVEKVMGFSNIENEECKSETSNSKNDENSK